MIDNKTLETWQETARRDDAFDIFVPSDIRQMIGEIYRMRHIVDAAIRFVKADINIHPVLSRQQALDEGYAELHDAVDEYERANPPQATKAEGTAP